jgi:hypothetical protein
VPAKKKAAKKKATKKTPAIAEAVVGVVVDPALPAVPITDPLLIKYEIAKKVAHTLAQSGLVPEAYRNRPNDCFVAIQMGAEIGMEPFQAIQSIAVIEGKPCLFGDGLIGVVRASPLCEWVEESISADSTSATCTTQRKGDPNPITATYSLTDATLAGIVNKRNWQKYPARMLQMRARAFCLRDAYPDVLKGISVAEEIQDYSDDPAPIVTYVMPERSTSTEEVAVKNEKIADVVKAIENAATMEELLVAGDMAKGLATVDHRNEAREIYKLKRAILCEPAGEAK